MPSHPATNNNKTKQFDDLLLTAIDNALSSLGESVKKSIYYHLEEKFCLKRSQIPNKLNKFQEAIEQIFGSGARFLEILIMKNLYLKTGASINMDSSKVCFVDYVNEMKHSYIDDSANSV
ncbi:MAG: hypothetical protein ACFCUE_07625 [Candidatus Bathyarchaeia archaeon]|jgi:superoxide dismutase